MTRTASRAFTLAEVALAIAVFAAAVTVLTQTYVNALLSLDSLESETALNADLRFVRSIVIKEPNLETFEEGGEIETLASGIAAWEAEVEPALVSDLFFVDLTIVLKPPDSREPVEFAQHLLLLRPTWSDPVERSELIAENTERLLSMRGSSLPR